MTTIQLEFAGKPYRAALSAPRDISIPLDFHGRQPSHFGAAPARAVPMEAHGFTGDTRLGGSCNAEALTLIPHCHGTHTECLGHVTDARIHVPDVVSCTVLPAAVITVSPDAGSDETADPLPVAGDLLVTASALGDAWSRIPGGPCEALVVRTLPNSADKQTRRYTADPPPPYFSLEAMDMLRDCGVLHLLTDLPSVDRFDDQGRLAGHRRFWGLAPGSREVGVDARPQATITEMVYVPDEVSDGLWLLDLQIAPFLSDASPSRPLLFPMVPA